MTFPDRKFADVGAYFDAYRQQIAEAAQSVDKPSLDKAARMLEALYERAGTLWVCGNGGSAGISGHFMCDHLKCIRTDTSLMPRVVSLAGHLETLTAIANDLSYAEVFVYQLQSLARPGDMLLTISSSGDSENVVRAAEWARANRVEVIAFTGFAGGRTARLADVNLHVTADNYGVIEDVHQSLMHVLAQYLRQARMTPALVAERKF